METPSGLSVSAIGGVTIEAAAPTLIGGETSDTTAMDSGVPTEESSQRVDGEMLDTEMLDAEMLDAEMLDSQMLDAEMLDTEMLDSQMLAVEALDSQMSKTDAQKSDGQGAQSWLERDCYSFGFFQLNRVLKRILQTELEHGLTGRVRYRSKVRLSFPACQVERVKLERDTEGAVSGAELLCNVMGLAGHAGPLPDHYTELLFRRARQKDFSLHEFLDIFNHRLLELFYAAWEKFNFVVPYERDREDPVFEALLSTMGAGLASSRASLPTAPEFGAYYASLMTRCPVSSEAAEVILSEYFSGIPVKLQQFAGRWITLDDDSRFILGNPDSGSQLGRFCPLGDQVWDVSGQVTLQLGPLSYEDYQAFGENGEKRAALKALFRHLTASAIDVDLKLLLGESREWRLGTPGAGVLRSSAWLGSSQEGVPVLSGVEEITFERAFDQAPD